MTPTLFLYILLIVIATLLYVISLFLWRVKMLLTVIAIKTDYIEGRKAAGIDD